MRAILGAALQYLACAATTFIFAVEIDKVWDIQTLEGPVMVILFLVWMALMILSKLPSRRSA